MLDGIKNNNISFNGSFLINYSKAKKGARQVLENTLGNHHFQIYDNFRGEQNRVMYVLRKSMDYDLAREIVDNNFGIRFKYMPNVDTKCRFDYENSVIDYLDNNRIEHVITNKKDLWDYVSHNRVSRQEGLSKPTKKEVMKSRLSKMAIFLEDFSIQKDSKGITSIYDNTGKLRVKMSPYNHYDVAFALVKESNNADSDIFRYAIDKEGTILHKFATPEDMLVFKQKFNDAVLFLCQPEKFSK